MKFLREKNVSAINIPHTAWRYMNAGLYQMLSETYSISRQKEIWTK